VSRRARRGEDFGSRIGRWAAAAIFSVGGHAILALFFMLTGFFSLFSKLQPVGQTSVNPIALRAVPRSIWEQNRTPGLRPTVKPLDGQREPPEAQAKKDELKKKEPEPIPKGKVVDVAPGNGLKPDDDAKFLAESNNRVDKETRSRDATAFYKNAAPRPSTTAKPSEGKGHDTVDKAVIAGNGGRGAEDAPQKEGQKRNIFEIPRIQKQDELALHFDGLGGGTLRNQRGSEELKGNSDRYFIQQGGTDGEDSQSSAGHAGDKELKTLAPSSVVLDRIAGAPANDVTPLDDVELGSGTFLNTREWKYSSFFNRVKQYVGMHWDPNSIVRTKDPTGEMYLYKDRYTVLLVTLDGNGLLKNVGVEKSCGVDFLDREAMAAFQRAQPFPNPPPGLQNDHGEIRFTFGFYLEVNKGGLQLFRGH
jgi:TonB family protein